MMIVRRAFNALYYTRSQECRLESLAITHQLIHSRCTWSFAAAICLAISVPALAQQSPPLPVDRTNSERERQRDMTNREYQLRNFGVEKDMTDDRQKKALMQQVEEDFNRILLLHNQIVRAISSETPLDYSFVADASGEIRKRSTRLQSSLMLRQTDTEKQESEQGLKLANNELKPALLSLCTHIKNFVTNPIIETPGTVDAKHLTRAKQDLAFIVNLSGFIRKHADQLRK